MRNFNEIYEKIYTEKNSEFERIRKKRLSITLEIIAIAIIIAIIVSTQSISLIGPFIFLLLIIGVIIIGRVEKKYKYTHKFKNEIIGTFVKECDENLSFYPERGIAPIIYRQGEFESYDIYSSEDLIQGVFKEKYGVQMAEVTTERESRDSDGDRTTYIIFQGIFGQADCAKEIPGFIKIHSDKGFFGKIIGDKNKIEMDSSEFEKEFDVHGIDKIVTMQILTSDVMTMMLEFKNQNKIKYELTIKNKKIFIRFHTGEVFEPNIFKESLDYSTLKKYYDIINFVFTVTKQINKAIEEAEI